MKVLLSSLLIFLLAVILVEGIPTTTSPAADYVINEDVTQVTFTCNMPNSSSATLWWTINSTAQAQIASNTTLLPTSNESSFRINMPVVALSNSSTTSSVWACRDNTSVFSANRSIYFDVAPARITIFSVLSDNKSSYAWVNTTLDESGDCKWSYTGSVTYANLVNTMTCQGASCFTTLVGLTHGNNTVNFRCEDDSGNTETRDQSFVFSTEQTEEEVIVVTPSGKLATYTGDEFRQIQNENKKDKNVAFVVIGVVIVIICFIVVVIATQGKSRR